jgi:hypothetical protein
MPAVFVAPMVTANVRRHEPLHPATQVSIFMRPQHRGNGLSSDKNLQPHGNFLVSLPHQVHKRREVIMLMKDVTAAIAPVHDMVNKPTS